MSEIIDVYIQKGDMGTWLELPIGKDDFKKAMNKIGAANSADITVGQYKTEMTVLSSDLLMNTDLNHVNYLAVRLAKMNEAEFAKLNSIMESSFKFTTVEQLIDYTYNTDYFLFRPDVNNIVSLARYYIYDTGLCQMPETWKGGIDLERFGAHVAQQERGVFMLNGYLMPSGDEWQNKLAKCGVPVEYHLYQ